MEGRRRPGFSNHYVFAKVMRDNIGICKGMLEVILGDEVGELEAVSVEEETASVHYRDVRFDALVASLEGIYDIEMQSYAEPFIGKRSRLMHAHIARRLLPKGSGFRGMRPAYVVFICTCDPIGLGFPAYTFEMRCREDGRAELADGATTILLNASADLAGAPPGLRDLLEYVRSGRTAEGALSSAINEAVEAAFEDEEWAMGFWTYEDEMQNRSLLSFEEGEAAGESKGRDAERKRIGDLLMQMKSEGKSLDEALVALESGL